MLGKRRRGFGSQCVKSERLIEYMKKRRKTYVSLGFRVLRVTQFFHSLLSETKKIGSWVIYGENEGKGFIEDLDRESGTALVKFVYPTLDGTYSFCDIFPASKLKRKKFFI